MVKVVCQGAIRTASDALKVIERMYYQKFGESFYDKLKSEVNLVQVLRRLRFCLDILYLERKPISCFYEALERTLNEKGVNFKIEDLVYAIRNGKTRQYNLRRNS